LGYPVCGEFVLLWRIARTLSWRKFSRRIKLL
jgi:hypothetical protein